MSGVRRDDCCDGFDRGCGFGGGFAFLVVLFILLIIVGASFCGGFGGGYAAPAYGYGAYC
ncbi:MULTISPECIES: YjcZ family sporulation protein [Peribacillus]|uniref:YjcZ family sporulation protein n=1 Tax=Peribacillus TaxID=2675229 RepID=UPI00257B9126|nr:YjcZ family sporulation protein [Peribacillus asahii]